MPRHGPSWDPHNTGRIALNLIRPGELGQSYIDPIARLQELYSTYQQYPGRVAGGSGLTGLSRGDRRGYDDMLEEQREFAALQNVMSGKDYKPMQTEFIGRASDPDALLQAHRRQARPAQWAQSPISPLSALQGLNTRRRG